MRQTYRFVLLYLSAALGLCAVACFNVAGTSQLSGTDGSGVEGGTSTSLANPNAGTSATTQSTDNGDGNQVIATTPIAAGTVEVWLTSADLTTLLARQTSVTLGASVPANANLITVDTQTVYQPFLGLGNALPDSSAYVIHQSLSAAQQGNLMTALFDPNQGINLSFLRLPMGASDFSHIGDYSYDDNSGNQDTTLANFSIAHDLIDIVPIAQKALALNPAMKFITTPWSPPAWMKNNTNMNSGGDNSLTPAMMPVLAQYFVKTVQAYAALGLPVWGVTPQNEPEFASGNYPCMYFGATDEASFIAKYLGPAFQAAGLTTNIMGFDHNWCGQNGGCPAPYAQTLASDANVAPYLHGIAWHCYSGSGSDMTTFHTANPNVGIFHTECATGPWLSSTHAATDYFVAALNLVFDTTRNWAQSTVLWPVALDENAGPQNSGCSNCRPFAIVHQSTDSYTLNPEYYAFGHLSKFLRPGAYRIDASDGTAGVHTVAFQNADKTVVLLAYNTSAAPTTFEVKQNNTQFTYTLAAGATATLRWNG